MAVTSADQGFFTREGVLRTENLNSTSSKTNTSTSSTPNTSGDISTQTAEATATAITDAVVVRISEQMNVGNTGFDSGVSAMVKEAVLSALRNKNSYEGKVDSQLTESSEAPTASVRMQIGGAYQNEILKGGQTQATENPSVVSVPPDIPADEDSKKGKPKIEKSGKKRGGAYQNELIESSKKSVKEA